MRNCNEQQRSEMYEDVSAIQADIKDLHDLFRIDLKKIYTRKKKKTAELLRKLACC
jgi:hypothetical protein